MILALGSSFGYDPTAASLQNYPQGHSEFLFISISIHPAHTFQAVLSEDLLQVLLLSSENFRSSPLPPA